jgi:hypothetical protein
MLDSLPFAGKGCERPINAILQRFGLPD